MLNKLEELLKAIDEIGERTYWAGRAFYDCTEWSSEGEDTTPTGQTWDDYITSAREDAKRLAVELVEEED